MDNLVYFRLLAVMVVTTYLIRAVPFVLFRKQIKNRRVCAFFEYIPYAVLSSMSFPSILYSTGSVIASACGLLAALILSWREKSLLTVAIGTCLCAFLASSVILLMT